MAVPFILWGAAALLAGTGVVKGVGALSDFDEAKKSGQRAARRYEEGEAQLDAMRAKTNATFTKLGKVKLAIFKQQIQHLLDVIRMSKSAGSSLKGFKVKISIAELKEMERLVLQSLEIERGLAAGAATGALAAMGAYSGVGTLAAASTGAAISGLSGVAATNATLAWLGGGALSAGGYGMAGGAIALGGIVLGPALAVGGFMMASKAEEALTKAQAYSANVDIALAEMERIGVVLTALQDNANELRLALTRLAKRFDAEKVNDDSDPAGFQRMIVLGKGLKGLLDIAVMDDKGNATANIKAQISGELDL
ncbi:hypothetical protein INH39_15410 [Massilia violaceinigra]|uniref:Chemotaxis protein n=1 Tax=Massilia violaceinigra TaxID=2045208 RepID=A0ABY4AJY2_9BURK|nr:hypothetical protein [Massilia violaceinigra]UOD32918.1 hypothetical protein INH39_15410 [Massilia violaceinigra]